RISARGLAQFVQARVDRWAQLTRGKTRQTPLIVHADAWKDFELSAFRPGEIPEPAESTPPGEPPAMLAGGWSLRQKYLQTDSYRNAPWALRRLEGLLLWGEQHWYGDPTGSLGENLRALPSLLRRIEDQINATDTGRFPRPPALTDSDSKRLDPALAARIE